MLSRHIAVLAALVALPPVRVSPGIQARKLILRVPPVCTQAAREHRIRGNVRFTALIGADGSVKRLRLISGHPLLVPAAR